MPLLGFEEEHWRNNREAMQRSPLTCVKIAMMKSPW
jgi:hypothetical protein